jgi:glycosidase
MTPPEGGIRLLLTLRGTPYLLYGEEIGMRNISLRRSEMWTPLAGSGTRFTYPRWGAFPHAVG